MLATFHTMGNVASAAATGHLTVRHDPNLIVFVGTGGSLQPDECRIGDVVVPQKGVKTKYYDKMGDSGSIPFIGKPKWGKGGSPADLQTISRDHRRYFQRVAGESIQLTGRGHGYVATALANKKALAEDLETWKSGKPPVVHTDASVFSWDLVLTSENYRKLLSEELGSKAIAVDMESFGFLSSARMLNGPGASKALSTIIVRGISDICGQKDEHFIEGSDVIAMKNAAEVACRILQNGYLA